MPLTPAHIDRNDAAEIPALTGLRAVAALWVLLFHIGRQAAPIHPDIATLIDCFAAGGFLGVDIFFVLSGFVIALNYSRKNAPLTAPAYLLFLRKRLSRIYPAHLVALLILMACIGALRLASAPVGAPSSRTLEGLLQSVLLIQGWAFPIRSNWNVPAWSVSVEMLAYLLFPVVLLAVTGLRSRTSAVLASVLLLCVLPLLLITHPVPGTMAYGVPRIAVEFSLGVILYSIWRSTAGFHPSAGGQRLALIFTIAAGNGLTLSLGEQYALAAAPALAAGLVWVLASGQAGNSCLSSAGAQRLGRISYSVYLIHWSWLVVAQTLLAQAGGGSPMLWGAVMAVAGLGSLWSAQLMYRWVEEPARRVLSGQNAGPSPERWAYGARPSLLPTEADDGRGLAITGSEPK